MSANKFPIKVRKPRECFVFPVFNIQMYKSLPRAFNAEAKVSIENEGMKNEGIKK